MKKIIFIIILLFGLNIKVNAVYYGDCKHSDIVRMKSIVSNINLSYDYYMENDEIYFNITVNNLVPEIYFTENNNYGRAFFYKDSQDGEIVIKGVKRSQGNLVFYSAKNECYGFKLGNKYYQLPKYNYYSGDEICEGLENYSLCGKWATVGYSRQEFEKLVDEYKYREELEKAELEATYEKTIFSKIIDFYIKYYYFIFIGIILVCITIIIISSYKKPKFDL